jgi:hypothetical protein
MFNVALTPCSSVVPCAAGLAAAGGALTNDAAAIIVLIKDSAPSFHLFIDFQSGNQKMRFFHIKAYT